MLLSCKLLAFQHLNRLKRVHSVLSELLGLELQKLSLSGIHFVTETLLLLETQIFFVDLAHDLVVVLHFVDVEAACVVLRLLGDLG